MKLAIPKVRGKLGVMLWMIALVVLLAGIIPVRIAIAHYQAPQPRAILVLGGDIARMKYVVGLSRENPDLPVWVSDVRSLYATNSRVFREAGIDETQLRYDFCATDTVTNFTCTVGDFSRSGIRHLYLVTSDYHMARAKAIATFVFGSRGIAITTISVPSVDIPSESFAKVLRDILRSWLWLMTGFTGAGLKPYLHS